jgi:acetylornithine deacetylase/succinyl-diaminopimelate desuccinylase-like protein
MTGSLPLVRDLQKRGFDVQITGFGESRSYHAPNEKAQLSDFEDGMRILGKILEYLETDA